MIANLPSTVQLSPSVAVTPLVLNCKSPLKGHPWLVIVDAAETSCRRAARRPARS